MLTYSQIVAVTLIVFGVFAVIAQTTVIDWSGRHYYYYMTLPGLWSGFLMVTTGLFNLSTYSRCSLYAVKTMSVLSIIGGITMISIFSWTPAMLDWRNFEDVWKSMMPAYAVLVVSGMAAVILNGILLVAPDDQHRYATLSIEKKGDVDDQWP